MKLTQYQVAALAEEFLKNTLKPEIDKYNIQINKKLYECKLELFSELGNLSIFKKAQKSLKDNENFKCINVKFITSEKSRTEISIYKNSTLEDILNNYDFRNHFSKNTKYSGIFKSLKPLPDCMTIRNQIVLATIGTSSVEEIMSKLKEKFC